MVYLLTIVTVAALIFYYDWGNKGSAKDAGVWYNALMIWFVAVSGFAYNIGSDTPIYMYEYDATLWSKYPHLEDLFKVDNDREPGWILLGLICRSISPEFALFKFVIALFCNWSIFRFIKRHSISPFTSILFYAFILYLHINFNSIRQAIAIGFFLIAYDKLLEKKWIKYYLLIIAAFLFHRSALICLIIPLLGFIKINKKVSGIIAVFLIVSFFIIISIDIQSLLYDILMANTDFLIEEDLNKVDTYFGGSMGNTDFNIMTLLYYFVQIFLLVVVLSISIKNSSVNRLTISVFVFYIILYTLNALIPVFFSRLLQYFDVFYICLLPIAIKEISINVTRKMVLCPMLIVVFAFTPVANLMSINRRTEISMFAQYYPYYSIFNPQIDPVRKAHFGSHR